MKAFVEMKKVKVSEVPEGHGFSLDQENYQHYIRVADNSPYLESEAGFVYGLRDKNIERISSDEDVYVVGFTQSN